MRRRTLAAAPLSLALLTVLSQTIKKMTSPQSYGDPSAEEIMRRRAEEIKSSCSEHNYHSFEQPAYTFIVSQRSNRLLYCPVPKAGWSTWKRLFYSEAGVKRGAEPADRKGFTSQWWRANLTTTSSKMKSATRYDYELVFIRDPYDRLVSGYSDKALHNNGRYVKKQRNPCSHINIPLNSPRTLSFPQFVDCILSRAASGHRSLEEYGAGSSLDIHWRPQTLLCDFCHRNYTIIGHMETMSQDQSEALRQLGMRNNTAWANPSFQKKSLSDWYEQLTDQQRKQLQQLYSHDFRILGYSSDVPTQWWIRKVWRRVTNMGVGYRYV